MTLRRHHGFELNVESLALVAEMLLDGEHDLEVVHATGVPLPFVQAVHRQMIDRRVLTAPPGYVALGLTVADLQHGRSLALDSDSDDPGDSYGSDDEEPEPEPVRPSPHPHPSPRVRPTATAKPTSKPTATPAGVTPVAAPSAAPQSIASTTNSTTNDLTSALPAPCPACPLPVIPLPKPPKPRPRPLPTTPQPLRTHVLDWQRRMDGLHFSPLPEALRPRRSRTYRKGLTAEQLKNYRYLQPSMINPVMTGHQPDKVLREGDIFID